MIGALLTLLLDVTFSIFTSAGVRCQAARVPRGETPEQTLQRGETGLYLTLNAFLSDEELRISNGVTLSSETCVEVTH